MAPQSEEFRAQVEGIDLTIAAETRRILVEWLGGIDRRPSRSGSTGKHCACSR